MIPSHECSSSMGVIKTSSGLGVLPPPRTLPAPADGRGAYLALTAQFDEKATVVQLGMDNLWLLSERGQQLFDEAISYDLCLRPADSGSQFIRGADGDKFALANRDHPGTELFGFGQIMGIEKDGDPFARDQVGQMIAQSNVCHWIKPGGWLFQEDERQAVKERAGARALLFHPPDPCAHQVATAVPEIRVGEQFFDAGLVGRRRHAVDAPVQGRGCP